MAQPLDPKMGGSITKADATVWIENYRKSREVTAHFYGSDIINLILSPADCVGIRIYYSLDDKGAQQMLLVGARADGSNIWAVDGAKTLDPDPPIGDKGMPCPPYCP